MRSENQMFDDRQKILTTTDHLDFARRLGCRDLAPERLVSRLDAYETIDIVAPSCSCTASFLSSISFRNLSGPQSSSSETLNNSGLNVYCRKELKGEQSAETQDWTGERKRRECKVKGAGRVKRTRSRPFIPMFWPAVWVV